MQLCFNVCLCIDLFLTFKYPFYPSKRRMKVYYIGTALVLIVIHPFTEGILLNNFDWFNHFIVTIMSKNQVTELISNESLFAQLKLTYQNQLFNIQLWNTLLILIYVTISSISVGFAAK